MASLHDSQLSAIASAIADLAERSATMAATLEHDGSGEPAAALFEVERALQMAVRSVERARRSLER
jgi:hypothetical protein